MPVNVDDILNPPPPPPPKPPKDEPEILALLRAMPKKAFSLNEITTSVTFGEKPRDVGGLGALILTAVLLNSTEKPADRMKRFQILLNSLVERGLVSTGLYKDEPHYWAAPNAEKK